VEAQADLKHPAISSLEREVADQAAGPILDREVCVASIDLRRVGQLARRVRVRVVEGVECALAGWTRDERASLPLVPITEDDVVARLRRLIPEETDEDPTVLAFRQELHALEDATAR
jgi:hypothetical protein